MAPYIIQLISQMPQITRIVCIVRKRGKINLMDRLSSALEAHGLYGSTVMDKIECVEGDVGQPRLGLSEENYNDLSETIDCVIHCAVRMDHLQKYRKTAPHEKFHTRTTNVLGTKHALEFATTKKTKMVCI